MPRDKLLRRCGLWWCDKKHYANGFCESHNASLARNGTPISPKNAQINALLNMVEKMRYLLIHFSDTSVPEIAYILDKTENQQRLFISQIGDCQVCESGYRARALGGELLVECDCGVKEYNISEIMDVS